VAEDCGLSEVNKLAFDAMNQDSALAGFVEARSHQKTHIGSSRRQLSSVIKTDGSRADDGHLANSYHKGVTLTLSAR
jgi:hypothetical protein